MMYIKNLLIKYPNPSHINCMTLGKVFTFPELQNLHFSSGDKVIYLIECLSDTQYL